MRYKAKNLLYSVNLRAKLIKIKLEKNRNVTQFLIDIKYKVNIINEIEENIQ